MRCRFCSHFCLYSLRKASVGNHSNAFVVSQVYVGVPKDAGAGEKEREGIPFY